MAQPPLVIVGGWQRKSLDMSIHSKDRLITAVNKGFDAMADVLDKDSDPVDVHSILTYLNAERSIALKFDKAKDDSLRELVYGLLESLHVSLTEWTEERNQKKETGENPTQTEEECALSLALIPLNGASLPIDNNSSNILAIIPNISPSFPIEPKEEPIDIHQPLPNDYQISASEIMRDEKMFKKEEMDDDNKEGITPHSNPIFPGSLDLLAQMPPLNALGDEMEFMAEDTPNDDVNSGMGDAVDDSFNGPPFNDDDSAHRTKRRSSRPVSRPMKYIESLEESDGEDEPLVKKSRYDDEVDNKRRLYKGDDKSKSSFRVSKRNDTVLECPECEYRTWTVSSWMAHLRLKHSTTPALAGLALLCECGNEYLSDDHSRVCNHDNTTVIRKTDGAIRRLGDEKVTPKCVLCEVYPKTACGYLKHLKDKHKSTLRKNDILLRCSCGLEIRCRDGRRKHIEECDPRQFTLHKRDEE